MTSTAQAKDWRVALFCAAQLREAAQARIVQSFGAYARGRGPGPTDEDLRDFARLMAEEHRLQRRQSPTIVKRRDEAVPQTPPSQIAAEKIGRDAPAAVGYGGLLDYTRISFGFGARTGEICGSCQTVNRHSARLCKCCSGKLPAFYAEAGEKHGAEPGLLRSGLAAPAARAIASALCGVAVVMVTMFLAPVAWKIDHPSTSLQAVGPRWAPEAARHAPDVQPGMLSAAVEAGMVPAALPAERAFAPGDELRATGPRFAPGHVDLASRAPSAAESEAAAPAAAVRRASSRESLPRGGATRTTSRAAIRKSLAECDGLNFFANAICMNNKCADTMIARSPRCVEPLRQRRLDEARRNPVLVG